ncbi:MAG: two-component system, OmpR family, sensor histidine kinase BaeS [Actinomycetota bacterium]|nr:two-component system, OmpR family, sensor histidine kinase BaeS [Actinomycetota bacterium]
MKRRLASFRLWLLVAMLTAGGVGLVGADISLKRIQQSDERKADRAQDLRIAHSIGARVETGISLKALRIMQSVLPYDQILVYRGGRQIFAGPAITGADLEVTETGHFPGGRVQIRDYHSAAPSSSLEITFILGAWILLVIAAAVLTTAILTRALQGSIEQSVAAADRVAVGDLGARIGAVGPDEFARLANAFDSMAARLEAADREQREFLADVAHEIATPVNAISGLATALLDDTLQMPAERADAAYFIEKETERLGSLLEDLRRLTHLDYVEVIHREEIDAADLLRSLATRFSAEAAKAGLSLSVGDGHHRFTTDKRVLETVLNNFVTNAIRYTPPGGRVIVRAARDGNKLALSVADTGPGMSPHDLERIFDRFYRVDQTRDRATGGSGLGLAIARRAAQALNGWIEVSSEVGHGSTFSIVLPIT